MKPVTSILIKNGRKCNWVRPVFLKIWKDGVVFKIYSFEEGKDLLIVRGLWQEDEGDQGTSK